MKLTSRVTSFESRNRIRRLIGCAVGMLLVIATTQAARAELTIPYPDSGTINPVTYTFTAASTGDVIAYYAIPHTTASFTEEIGLLVNGVSTGLTGLNNHTSTLGQAFDLGHANAGDTLVFQLNVFALGGYSLYSRSSMNSDGDNHVYSTDYDGTNPGLDAAAFNAANMPHGTYVAFEDLRDGTSDWNYHDDAFVFSNTMLHPSPEPSSALIVTLVGGLGGAGIILKRRRATVRNADA
jgi:hypothetical protein